MTTDFWKDLREFFLSVETQAWSAQSLQESLQTILNQITRLLDADRMSLIVFNELLTGLDFYLRSGPGQELVDLTVTASEMLSGLTGWVIKTHQSALSSQYQSDPRESEAVQRRRRETIAGAILVVPLLSGSRLLGTLTAINRPGQRDFQDQDLHLLEFVADYSGNLITHVRLLQELRQAKESAEAGAQVKTQILSNLSHELRTPLFTLVGFTELLKGTNLTDTQSDYLDALESAETHLANLINGLIDLAKIEAQELQLELDTLVFDKLVHNLVSSWGPLATTKGLNLVVKLSGQLPPCVETDPERLRQILDILLDNAVKFTSQGVVRVDLDATTHPAGLRELTVKVSDTGIGISPEKQQQLFQPFRQLDGSSRRHYGGLGLGLALAQRLVRILGGNLTVTSFEGKGSEFLVKIPFLPFEGEVAARLEDHPEVLFVEDDPFLALTLQKASEQLGLRYVLVDTVSAALKEVAKGNFHFVFLGTNLSLTPQLEALDQLKNACARLASPEFVLLLSESTEAALERLRQRGLTVLPRPITAARLREYFLGKRATK
ncbi:MAG: GAF domain-containing protein [Spirochaetales bacterium]|nr:GAF domain-containing protein [Spirochaetales bacterium]